MLTKNRLYHTVLVLEDKGECRNHKTRERLCSALAEFLLLTVTIFSCYLEKLQDTTVDISHINMCDNIASTICRFVNVTIQSYKL